MTVKKPPPKPPFREYAGVLCAFVVVTAYVSIGFVDMAAQMIFGTEISVAGDWGAAMLSLASASLGYLIGKQLNGTNGEPK